MKVLKKVWDNLELVLCIVIFVVMLVALLTQVIGRFVFSNAPKWSEELGRYLMIWLVFASTALASKYDSHVRVDMVFNLYPKSWRKYVEMLGQFVFLAFSVFLTIKAIPFVQGTFKQGQIGYTVPFKLGWIYLAMPAGFGLTSLRILGNIINRIKNWKTPESIENSEAST